MEVTATTPLANIRVLDLSRMHPGAFLTQVLADLGAEVIKLEAPGAGDGLRAMPELFKAAHVALNRGKRSVEVDLRTDEGADVFRGLARAADVVVESHKPGALDKAGIGYTQLRELNPRLVWCSITGFGSTGPEAAAPGHDITYLARSGLMQALAGGSVPAVPDTVVSLPLAALTGVIGILASLAARAVTGVGVHVDANMYDSAMWLLSEGLTRQANAPAPGWGAFASRNVYRCADGRYVSVAASEPKPWVLLCEALDLPGLASYRMGSDEAGATAALAAAFATKPAHAWAEQPGLAGGVALVADAADVLADSHAQSRDTFRMIAGTTIRVLSSPIRIDGVVLPVALRPAPDLGADTALFRPNFE